MARNHTTTINRETAESYWFQVTISYRSKFTYVNINSTDLQSLTITQEFIETFLVKEPFERES